MLRKQSGNADSRPHRDATTQGAKRRGQLFAAQCPSREIPSHLTSRWGVLVLIALLSDTHRFSELRRKIGGVSEKMLAQTLQSLEHDGFVRREQKPVVPPHVEYSVTEFGATLNAALEPLCSWGQRHMERIATLHEE